MTSYTGVIPIRCLGCKRLRIRGEWHDHPGRMPFERGGCCGTCQREQEAMWLRLQIRADNAARADRRRGKKYGPADQGMDPFR